MFYRDFLGFQVARDEEERFDGTGRDGTPWTLHRRGVYLRFPDAATESFLVLDRSITPEPFGAPAAMGQLGVHHVGLWVDDVDALVARAEELGIDRYGEGSPTTYPASEYGGSARPAAVKTTIFRDPDGTLVQVDQWLDQVC